MTSDTRRVLGLTRRNSIVLLALASVLVFFRFGGWLLDVRNSGELPEREDVALDLNVNTADADELLLLPGIGESTAAMIVKERSENGPFESLQDLTRIKGIGPSTVERIRPYAECR